MTKTPLTAICHNSMQLLSVHIGDFNESECELECGPDCTSQVFATDSRILLNLLDEKDGRTESVPIKICSCRRAGGRWVYRIRWRSLPKLLATRTA